VAAKADVAAIVQALKLYRLDNGFYPATDQGLAALVQKPASSPVPATGSRAATSSACRRTRGAATTSTSARA